VTNSSDAPAVANVTDNISDAWGLRILDSQSILVYGAGHYSFFDDYSTNCSAAGNGEVCQRHIVDIINSPDASVYNLNTVGTTYMITLNGQDEAFYEPNVAGFIDNIALFRDSSGI
jgi:glucan 1,3-beta-glucosidase